MGCAEHIGGTDLLLVSTVAMSLRSHKVYLFVYIPFINPHIERKISNTVMIFVYL